MYKYMNYPKYTTREEIQKHLKRGDYELASIMTKGKIAKETIRSQVLGRRTLKDPVIEVLNKIIESRERLLNLA